MSTDSLSSISDFDDEIKIATGISPKFTDSPIPSPKHSRRFTTESPSRSFLTQSTPSPPSRGSFSKNSLESLVDDFYSGDYNPSPSRKQTKRRRLSSSSSSNSNEEPYRSEAVEFGDLSDIPAIRRHGVSLGSLSSIGRARSATLQEGDSRNPLVEGPEEEPTSARAGGSDSEGDALKSPPIGMPRLVHFFVRQQLILGRNFINKDKKSSFVFIDERFEIFRGCNAVRRN